MAIVETVEVAVVASTNLPEVTDTASTALRSLESSAKKTSQVVAQSAGGTKRLNQSLQATEKFAQGAGGRVGELAGRFRNLGEGLSILGGTGGVLAGVTLGFVALTAAAAGLAAAAVKIVMAAEDAGARLEEMGMATDKQRDSIKSANTAMSSLSVVMDEMVVTMGEELAPAVERVSILLLALGLAAVDVFKKVGGLGGTFEKVFVDPFEKLEDAISDGMVAIGLLSEEDAALAKSLRALSREASGFDTTMTDLEGTLGEYIDRAKGVIDRMDQQRRATKEVVDMTKELESAQRRLMSAQHEATLLGAEGLELFRLKEEMAKESAAAELERIAAELASSETSAEKRRALLFEQIAAETELDTALREIAMERESFLEETDRERQERNKAAQEAMAQDEQATTQTILQGASVRLGSFSSMLEELNGAFGKTSKAAKAFFIAQKAASLGQVTINTAQAVTKAIADWGPPPSPVGIAAIAAALAVGGAQAATIAAQQPPKYHMGTMGVGQPSATLGTPAGSGAGAGEIAAILQAGETVRTREQERVLQQRVPIVLIQQDHRLFEAQARTSLNRGVLREAVQPGASLGQERYDLT